MLELAGSSGAGRVTCGVPQSSVPGPILYLLYTSPLGDILQRPNMSFHFYADDSQLNTTFNDDYNDDSDQDLTVQCIEACLADTKKNMDLNKLKLNGNKNEIVIFLSTTSPTTKAFICQHSV